VEPVIKYAGAAANGRLAISENVPGKSKPGSGLHARSILQLLVVNPHALEWLNRTVGKLADRRRRYFLPGHRVAADPHIGCVAERLNERRLLRAIVSLEIEGRQLIVSAVCGIYEVEAHPGIHSKAARYFPGILREPLDVKITRVPFGVIVRLRVTLDG